MLDSSTDFIVKNQDVLEKVLAPSFTYKVGNVSVSPSYFQAGAIILLIFLLVYSLAHLRRMKIDWSLKGGFSMIAIGFLLAIVLEGFLMLGGKTVLIEVFSWENPPKPIAKALDSGRAQLIEVLGVSDENTAEVLLQSFENLSPEDKQNVTEEVCNQ